MAWTTPPVYTVGQVLTAAAMNAISGDLNAVGLVKLWDSVEAGVSLPAASITTPSLPQTYKSLHVVWKLVGSSASSKWLLVRCNGDSGLNYAYSGYGSVAGAAMITEGSASDTSLRLGILHNAEYSSGTMECPAYNIGTEAGFWAEAFRADTVERWSLGGIWVNTTAITTLTFLLDVGNIALGRITVYGKQ